MPSLDDPLQPGDHDRQRDVRRLAKLLRDGDYTYDQSKHLVAGPPPRRAHAA